MKVQREEIADYLLSTNGWEENRSANTVKKIKKWKKKKSLHGLSPIEHLFIEHQLGRKSTHELAKEAEISQQTIFNMLKKYNLPTLTQAEAVREKWQDPEFRERQAEAVREKWKDPEFRERNAEATREMLYDRWKDEEFRKRNAEAVREKWKDPEFREKQAEAVREMLYDRWKDPEFREKQAEAVRENWKDEEFRKRNAEAVRIARTSPATRIKGYRVDINKNAETTWEANLHRIINYCNRKEVRGKIFELTRPSELSDIIKVESPKLRLDLLVKDPRGNLVGYEIVTHPQRKTYEIAQLAEQQHGIKVIIITERRYQRLEDWFRKKIAYWENPQDNIRINPRKYAVV